MLGPRHTFESVAKDLADGLEEGTIVLHPAEPTEADVKNLESMAEAELARYRRLEIWLWIITGLLVVTAVSLPIILPAIFPRSDHHAPEFPHSAELVIVGFFIGLLTGNLLTLKAHKRSVELKTFIQVLKMADASTARRLVLWEGPKLREKAFAP
jgi:hypothetical protein